MRVIEKNMVNAVKSRKNMTSKNTSVHVGEKSGEVKVCLFGNRIAVIDKNDKLTISNCGWQSKTTLSRINALLRGLNYHLSIYQKNYKCYLYNNSTNSIVKKLNFDFTETL